jgi:hypothetical protein
MRSAIRAFALLGLASTVFAVPAARSETGHKSRQGSHTPRSSTVIVCSRFFPPRRGSTAAVGRRARAGRTAFACSGKCRTFWWLRAARVPAADIHRPQSGSLRSCCCGLHLRVRCPLLSVPLGDVQSVPGSCRCKFLFRRATGCG